jgi:hypothetical protein
MTQEDKELLIKDLCSRLPYGVFCVGTTYELDDDGERYIPVKVKDTLTEIHNYKLETASVRLGLISSCKLETVKPCLRPMSSMTEEEKHELLRFGTVSLDKDSNAIDVCCVGFWNHAKVQDYLNSIHIDYRGLIPKGLAIEVIEENNPYKE